MSKFSHSLVLADPCRPALESDWESDLKDLLRRMLAKDPSQRIVMADLRVRSMLALQESC